MGFGLIFGAISAVASVASGIAQASAANKAAKAQQQAANAQKEANNVQAAQVEVQSSDSRRQAIRENRIRRAQIMAASNNQGTGSSSGAIGAGGALNTNIGTMVGSSLGQSNANRGINANMQRAADFTSQANTFLAKGQATAAMFGGFQNALSGFSSIFDTK